MNLIKKFLSLSLATALLSVSLLSATNSDSFVVRAASPMPTVINTHQANIGELTTYYQGVEGQKGDTLVASLYQKIRNHNEYDYESTTHRTIYKIIDRNWELSPLTSEQLNNFDYSGDNPFIRKFYADYNDSELTADRFRNSGASRVSFDKEHIWAQSLGNFGRSGGAGSDFHSLVPSDVIGNQNAHSNYNFATPTSSISTYNNDKGTYVGRNGLISGQAQKVFEPLDAYKGDIARAMFYMSARYYEYIDTLHPKLTLVNGSPAAVTASLAQAGLAGDLATLLEWHTLDPVDEYEINRNNLIYNNYQGNRNPFIDFPDWAEIAFDTTYSGDGAVLELDDPVIVDPVVTLTSISAEISNDSRFYFYDQLSHNDFVLTAHYSDNTSKIITNYTMSLNGNEELKLISLGEVDVTFSYQEGSNTKTVALTINVELSTIHYVLIGGGLIIFIGILVAVPKARKKVLKKAKKAIKKSTRKKAK